MAVLRVARARRRTGGVTAVLALLAALLGQVAPAGAAHYSNTSELSGGTNVAAAASWSRAAFPNTTSEVLLGRDDLFADSLASGSMQGSRPLLLTTPSTLSAEANTELNRLKPSVVNILGGSSAVSDSIATDLENRGYTVRRFSGPTRIETAIDIARRIAPSATTALVAAAFAPTDGDETRAFADSIAAGGWAAATGYPVLLTQSETLTTSTRNYLRSSLIKSVIVIGGTSAVSDATMRQIQDLGISARRVSGPTRFDTAVRIAQERGFSDATESTEVILAEGQASFAWAPGFAAAAYAKAKNAPIVLSNGATIPAATNAFLTAGAAAAVKLVCAPRVDPAACTAASARMGHTPITGAMPKLASVALSTAAAGVQEIRYTFSEPLTGNPVAARFKCYQYDGDPILGTSASLVSGSSTVVAVTFNKADADLCTTAAVAHDAVKSTEGVANPEGNAGLRSYTRVARTNDKPMLVGGDIREVDTDTWAVDFVFDKAPASNGLATSFHLVINSATGVTLIEDGDRVSRSGNVITVQFDFLALPNESDVTRLAVDAGGAGNGVPASVFRFGGGGTNGPDLLDLTVLPAENRVLFHFDNVSGFGTAAGYWVYDEAGNTYNAVSAVLSTTQAYTVEATFPSLTTRRIIVGGWVNTGTAQSAGGTNALDERGEPRAFAAGVTNAPVLDRVIKGNAPSGGTRITFRFKELIEESTGGLFVYSDVGERTPLPADSCGAVQTDIVCDIATSAAIHAAVKDSTMGAAAYNAVRPAGTTGLTGANIPNHEGSKTYSPS